MSSIEVIINGVTQSVSKQQLFSMAAQGIINSQTPIMVNGKLATAGQVKASKNPGNWTVASGCVLMGWWWGAYILSSCLNICFWAQDMIENVDTLLLFNTCNIFFHLTIWPFANILALLVVKEVCRCQQEAYQQLHSSTGPVPISPFPVQSFPQQPMGYQQGWWQQHY